MGPKSSRVFLYAASGSASSGRWRPRRAAWPAIPEPGKTNNVGEATTLRDWGDRTPRNSRPITSCDAIQRPQLVGIAVGGGPFQQQFQQLPTLILAELGWAPRHRLGRQRLGPPCANACLQPTDRGFRAADAMGNFLHRQSSLQQFDRLPPPLLQRLRRTVWSHASYIAFSLHYFYEMQ